MSKIKHTEFDGFTDHLHDVIFQQSVDYLSDCVGTSEWGEELHEAHGLIMYNAVKSMAKTMRIKL